jgi:hypothetical protein
MSEEVGGRIRRQKTKAEGDLLNAPTPAKTFEDLIVWQKSHQLVL